MRDEREISAKEARYGAPCDAFYHIWQKWGAPNDITLSWPFVMLGEAVFEREDESPGV
jgi:hypothetical protein